MIIIVVAIVAFSLLFGGMLVLGLMAQYPWVPLVFAVYLVWRMEVKPWLCSQTTSKD